MLALRALTGLTATLMVLSPSIAISKIIRDKSIGSASIFPLLSLLANSFMWTLYGFLSDNVFPVAVAFGLGVVASIFYLIVFDRYCESTSQRNRNMVVSAVVTLLLVIVAIYAVVTTAMYRGDPTSIVGYIGIVTAVLLYGAPLEKAVHVWRTKNAQSVQVPMVICGVLHNSVWVLYTSMEGNWFMFVPNMISLPLGFFMLALCILYRPKRVVVQTIELPSSGELAVDIILSPRKLEWDSTGKKSSPSLCYVYDSASTPLAPATISSRDCSYDRSSSDVVHVL